MRPKLLIVNGSRHGTKGQSGLLAQAIKRQYRGQFSISQITLNTRQKRSHWFKKIKQADCFLFVTGTYWDSWGAPLQHFLEEATVWEASELWLGKPAAVLVSEHSTGGKHVLATLQGVLNSLGLLIVPLGGMVISKSLELLRRELKGQRQQAIMEDFWGPQDISVMLHNLYLAAERADLHSRRDWQAWSCDRKNFHANWLSQRDVADIC